MEKKEEEKEATVEGVREDKVEGKGWMEKDEAAWSCPKQQPLNGPAIPSSLLFLFLAFFFPLFSQFSPPPSGPINRFGQNQL
jgi:hypothetical protein